MNKYDLAIIGAGAGGLNSAFNAVGEGKSVILIERNAPGGECTWAGCVPSKALIQMAKDVKLAQKFSAFDVKSEIIMRNVRAIVEEAHQAESLDVLKSANIDYLSGTAVFKSANSLDVDGREVLAEKIIIATGSSAFIPAIPGLDKIKYLTNENFFQLKALPKSIILLGAGAIGVELSQAMQRLGVQVSLVDMADTVLPREEKDLAFALQQHLVSEGVEIQTSCTALNVREDKMGIVLTVNSPESKKEIRGEAIMLALGRKPNTNTLNLNEIGVEFSAKGISVNEFCETSVENVYAVGDVVGPYLFSHTGGYQARALVRNLYGSVKLPINLENVAWCTFTDPELARCGVTEDEARREYGDSVRVYTAAYSDLDRAVVDQKTFGMAKVICNNEGYILGASILGERACELLCELQVLRQHGIPFHKLQETIHPYPGYSELLLSMSLEAYTFFSK